MTFDEASQTTMPYGPHAGRPLGRIGARPGGLLYLDDLFSAIEDEPPYPMLADALAAYLAGPCLESRRLQAVGF